MSGLEAIVGLKKMTIHQCQELAKDVGFDKATFYLCGPKDRIKAKWLDAYFGLFQVDGDKGFVSVQQFQYNPDVWCEDLMPEEQSDAARNPE